MRTSSPIEAAYELLNRSIMHHKHLPIGTVAAVDPDAVAENYLECFVRDFVPSAIVFLLDGKTDIVRNFLEIVLLVRDQQIVMKGHHRALGLMPASFKAISRKNNSDILEADFGDRAIGRVAPVDSAMWWIILLRAYCQATNDYTLAHQSNMQEGIRQILSFYLNEGFETSPALLVPDASFMIDRRMGVYGHPLEIQALFYAMLTCVPELLLPSEQNDPIIHMTKQRAQTLLTYVRLFYWLDVERLSEINRLKTEEFGHEAVNVLNIYPEIIPDWVDGWLCRNSGYLVGNLGASRMDFRFFSSGNLLSILFGLTTYQQSKKIMRVFENHWPELIGEMPVKILYPAAEGERWAWVTGKDPKNAPWSYHNGGSWPCLLWQFTAAAIATGRADLAQNAMIIATERLALDNWPEYYDGKMGSLVGRRANYYQTWSAASLIISNHLLENPDSLNIFQSIMFMPED